MADNENLRRKGAHLKDENFHSHPFRINIYEKEYSVMPHGEINALFRIYEQHHYVTSVTLNNDDVWEAIPEDLDGTTQQPPPDINFIEEIGKAIEAGI